MPCVKQLKLVLHEDVYDDDACLVTFLPLDVLLYPFENIEKPHNIAVSGLLARAGPQSLFLKTKKMADWVSLFGDKIQTKDGLKDTKELLSGKKVVGVYFSAHWCPPCR